MRVGPYAVETLKEARLANITLIDDDENIVASVSLALESHGHKITAYHDGATGLEALETTPPIW